MTAFGRTIGKQLLDDARQGIRRQPGPGQGGGGLSRTRNGNGNGPGLSIEVSQDTIQDIGNLILGAINDGVSLTMTIDNVSRDVTNFSDNDIRTIINANRGK